MTADMAGSPEWNRHARRITACAGAETVCDLCNQQPYGVCKCGCGRPVGKNGCTAHSKRSRILCNGSAVIGRCTCRMHSGRARRGAAHPRFKTGRFSIDVPARYYATTLRSVESPESRENRVQIGLLDGQGDDDRGPIPDDASRVDVTPNMRTLARGGSCGRTSSGKVLLIDSLVAPSQRVVYECVEEGMADYFFADFKRT